MCEAKRKCAGFATLEAGLYSILLMSFITGAFATLDYLRLQSQLDSALEKVLHNSAITPYRIKTDTSGVSLQIDQIAIQTHLDNAIREVEGLLQDSLGNRTLEAQSYRIEANYFEIGINHISGQSTGIQSMGIPALAGSLNIPAELEQQTQLETDIINSLTSLVDSSGRFLYAIPSVQFGSASKVQFLAGAVLISMRVFLEVPGGFTKNILEAINIEPITYSLDSTTLRGELRL